MNLKQGNVTLTHFLLLIYFSRNRFPTVILADVAIQQWWINVWEIWSRTRYDVMMIWWYDDTRILGNDLFHVYIQRRDNGWFFPALIDFNGLEEWIGRKVFLLHGQIWPNLNFMDLQFLAIAMRKKPVLVWHKYNSK